MSFQSSYGDNASDYRHTSTRALVSRKTSACEWLYEGLNNNNNDNGLFTGVTSLHALEGNTPLLVADVLSCLPEVKDFDRWDVSRQISFLICFNLRPIVRLHLHCYDAHRVVGNTCRRRQTKATRRSEGKLTLKTFTWHEEQWMSFVEVSEKLEKFEFEEEWGWT